VQFYLEAFAELMTPVFDNPKLLVQLAALLVLAFTIKLATKATKAQTPVSFASLFVAGFAFVATILWL